MSGRKQFHEERTMNLKKISGGFVVFWVLVMWVHSASAYIMIPMFQNQLNSSNVQSSTLPINVMCLFEETFQSGAASFPIAVPMSFSQVFTLTETLTGQATPASSSDDSDAPPTTEFESSSSGSVEFQETNGDPAPVPIPGAVWLLGAGLAGFVLTKKMLILCR